MKKLKFKSSDFLYNCQCDECIGTEKDPAVIAQEIFDKWFEESDLENVIDLDWATPCYFEWE